jgi:hypothetical protein
MAKFLTEQEVYKEFFPVVDISKITLETTNIVDSAKKAPRSSPIIKSSTGEEKSLVATVDFIFREKLRNGEIGLLAGMNNFRDYLYFKVTQIYGKFVDGKFAPVSSRSKIVPINSDKNFRIFSSIDVNGAVNYDYHHSLKFKLENAFPEYLSYSFEIQVNRDKFKEDFNIDLGLAETPVVNFPVIDKRKGDGVVDYRVQDFRQIKEIERSMLDISELDKTLISPMIKFDKFAPNTSMLGRPANYFSDIHVTRDLDESARFFFSLDYKKLLVEKSLFGGFFDNISPSTFFKAFKICSFNVLRRRVKLEKGVNAFLTENVFFRPFSNSEEEKIIVSSKEGASGKIESVTGLRNLSLKVTKKSKDSFVGTIKEVDVDTLEVEKDVKFFTGTDFEVGKLTQGYYQYGVEIEIEDFTKNKFIEFRDILERSRGILEEYLTEGSLLGRRRLFSDYETPHIRTGRELQRNETRTMGNYDLLTNKFTEKFIQEQLKKYIPERQALEVALDRINERGSFLNLANAPWVSVPFNYIKIMKILSNITETDAERIRQFLITIIHPATGNPEGVSIAIKLVEQLTEKVGRVIGIYKEASNVSGPKNSWVGGIGFRKNIKLKKWFTNQVFDASLEKGVGLDYFSLDVYKNDKNLDGLKVISGRDYEERTNLEVAKYFKLENEVLSAPAGNSSDTTKKTKHSSLSPSVIRLRKNSVSTIDLDVSVSKNEQVNMAEIISSAMKIKRGKIDFSKEVYEESAKNIVAELGIVANIEEKSVKPLSEKESSVTPTISSTSKNKPVTTKKTGEKNILDKVEVSKGFEGIKVPKQNINFTLHSIIASRKAEGSSKKNKPSIFNLDIGHKDSEMNKSENALPGLPNQIKSLVLESKNSGVVKMPWQNLDPIKNVASPSSTVFRYNYLLLETVEVFSGYEEAGDGKQIKIERWVPLTEEIYNKNTGKMLLCRLKDYHNTRLGIVRDESISLPVYNEYFFINPEGKLILEKEPVKPYVMASEVLFGEEQKNESGSKERSVIQPNSIAGLARESQQRRENRKTKEDAKILVAQSEEKDTPPPIQQPDPTRRKEERIEIEELSLDSRRIEECVKSAGNSAEVLFDREEEADAEEMVRSVVQSNNISVNYQLARVNFGNIQITPKLGK